MKLKFKNETKIKFSISCHTVLNFTMTQSLIILSNKVIKIVWLYCTPSDNYYWITGGGNNVKSDNTCTSQSTAQQFKCSQINFTYLPTTHQGSTTFSRVIDIYL